MENFYLTTTLPYVNADPHIGFALEMVHADISARYHKLLGYEVFFNTGTDEHGIKIYRNALEEKREPQEYVNEYAKKFQNLKDKLNLYPDLHFVRTTDSHHKNAAQEFWRRCLQNGDIYKKNYTTKYCVGCELEKTDSELVNGACPIHQNLAIELIEEENYFFRFSRYGKQLLEMYENRPDFVIPDYRFNEIRRFVEEGLQDFSVSRLAKKMPWGIPVPGDAGHVMYVWFDALINYISTLGWPEDEANFAKFWGTNESPNAVQVAGKDQIRQQAAMWQAMLMSAGLPPSKQIVIHGFINVGGQKMSKSLGNVIDPIAIADEYGVDSLRYFLTRHIHPFEDSDFTVAKFKEAYNANLANGIGNLLSRVMKMAEDHLDRPVGVESHGYRFQGGYIDEMLGKYRVDLAMEYIWSKMGDLDKEITEKKPFSLIKEKTEEGIEVIKNLVLNLYRIGCMLEPFMPDTSKTIIEATKTNKKPANLFPRKD